MRAFMVCVDYSDLLSVTLPYNRHHFNEVHVCSTVGDTGTRRVVEACSATLHTTDLFYADGAAFNKWRALEWTLGRAGRYGDICLMDADVLWPKGAEVACSKGLLFSPLRRMLMSIDMWRNSAGEFVVPPEDTWSAYHIHRNVEEWAGYTQIFHADDQALGDAPWHDTTWRHAGGADSFFQAKWPAACKARPPWNVLHIGEPGANWMGRATPYMDGSVPAEMYSRRGAMLSMWYERRRREKAGEDRFAPEKLL